MAVDPVPYVVHGAKHSADIFRQAFHESTSGGEGISTPTSLHVRQTATPSNQVRVRAGGAIILNSYQGGAGQSYAVRNVSDTMVDVPASDSTGPKSYYIIVRVSDPQFAGQAPEDPLEGPYVFMECVPQSANITDPHLKLAAVVVPASTATIINSMITSMRELAQPKMITVNRSRPLNLTDVETLTMTDASGERFPNSGGGQNIVVPSWATRAIIEAEWLMINERPGNAYGAIWVEYGPLASGGDTREYSTQRFRWNTQAGSDSSRGIWKISDDVYIPAALRGSSQVFSMRGYLTYASDGSARPQMDQHSGIVFKVTFMQVADASDT